MKCKHCGEEVWNDYGSWAHVRTRETRCDLNASPVLPECPFSDGWTEEEIADMLEYGPTACQRYLNSVGEA